MINTQKNNPRALVISPQPFFSPRGTPFSVYYRTLVTAELGVNVDLLTYGEGEDVEIEGVRIIRIPRFRFLGPVKVGPSFKKLFLDVFLFAWTVFLLLRRRYAFVHAHEEAVFFCRFLKPLFRFRMVYDMHSSLPQQLTNFGFTKSRLLIGVFRWLENSCLHHANAVITICPDLAEYALKIMPVPSRHLLIENSIFDDVHTAASEKDDFETASAIELPADRDVILYAGTFELYQGIDLLIEGFAKIQAEHPRALLVLAGGTTDQVASMKAHAEELGVANNCLFLGRVPPQQARNLVGQADVLVSPRIRGTNTPLKVYEQLASGVPLVATDIHSHTQVLDAKVCYLVAPTPAGLGDGLKAALRADPETQHVASAAKDLYEREYSRPVYLDKMKRLLIILGLDEIWRPT